MKIYSKSIINGHFKEAIGNLGKNFYKNVKPSYSFHLAWQDLPHNTQSLALTFVDYDAIPACGFTWIHWLVANINPNLNELPENASITTPLLQGITSFSSRLLPVSERVNKEEDAGYGGCAPPDRPHLYTITVYALDALLPLKTGFMMNDLLKAVQPHLLDTATLEAIYAPKI